MKARSAGIRNMIRNMEMTAEEATSIYEFNQSEPIVLTDLHLAPLSGHATEAFALRAWRGTDWSAVPFQVDEFGKVIWKDGDLALGDNFSLSFIISLGGDVF